MGAFIAQGYINRGKTSMQLHSEVHGTRFIEADRLEGIEIIREGDYYIAEPGLAKPCPPLAVGKTCGSYPDTFVRPTSEIFADERELDILAHCGCNACAARDEATGELFIITYH
jgi:hypothetical protein